MFSLPEGERVKKSALAFGLILIGIANTAVAQSSPIQIGIDIGMAIASISGDDSEGSESRNKPFGGASLVVQKPGAKFGFQTGLLLVPKGATTDIEGGRGALEINYLEIPLLFRLSLPLQGSRIVPSILAGGSLGIKSSCNIVGESGSQSAKIGCDDSLFEGELDLKTVDVGVSGGVEVAIPMGSRFLLSPTVRYTRGLTDIGDSANNADAKNSVFQIGAMFRIKM
jgi:hypothetical protein